MFKSNKLQGGFKMSGFFTNYSDVDDYTLLPPGEYEVVVHDAYRDFSKNDKEHIVISLVVRNDVEQKFMNRRIWHDIYKAVSPTEADMECEGFSSRMINTFCKAVGVGDEEHFNSINDWLDYLNEEMLNLRVVIRHDTWGEKPKAKVVALAQSRFPECYHKFATVGN
jgi:hypothetical protein